MIDPQSTQQRAGVDAGDRVGLVGLQCSRYDWGLGGRKEEVSIWVLLLRARVCVLECGKVTVYTI